MLRCPPCRLRAVTPGPGPKGNLCCRHGIMLGIIQNKKNKKFSSKIYCEGRFLKAKEDDFTATEHTLEQSAQREFELARTGATSTKTGEEENILKEAWKPIGGRNLVTEDGAKAGEHKGEKEKFEKREKIVIPKPSEKEENERKDKERKQRKELHDEKMKLGGITFDGKEIGPGLRGRMLRMGNIGSSDNHATVMEDIGRAAVFNDGAGDRDEDELTEGAVGGISGFNNEQSGKFTVCVDDSLYTYTPATSHQVDHMSKTLNAMVQKLQEDGKLGQDKSSKKAIAKKVAKINRISQQAILKALSLD